MARTGGGLPPAVEVVVALVFDDFFGVGNVPSNR